MIAKLYTPEYTLVKEIELPIDGERPPAVVMNGRVYLYYVHTTAIGVVETEHPYREQVGAEAPWGSYHVLPESIRIPPHANAKAHAAFMAKMATMTSAEIVQGMKDCGIYDKDGNLTPEFGGGQEEPITHSDLPHIMTEEDRIDLLSSRPEAVRSFLKEVKVIVNQLEDRIEELEKENAELTKALAAPKG